MSSGSLFSEKGVIISSHHSILYTGIKAVSFSLTSTADHNILDKVIDFLINFLNNFSSNLSEPGLSSGTFQNNQ
jgi:hypothetical protein